MPGLANFADRKTVFQYVYQDSPSTDNPKGVLPQTTTVVPEGELQLPTFWNTVRSLDQVVPVEVKAGKTGTLKSMHVFLREKRRRFGLRFNMDQPSLLEARTSVTAGAQIPFQLLSLPLYLVGQTHRLCEAVLRSEAG